MSRTRYSAMRACSVPRLSIRRSASRSSSRRRGRTTTSAPFIRECWAPSWSNSCSLCAGLVFVARRRLARLEYRPRCLLRAHRRRNVLAVGHDPQHVGPGELRDVAVAPAAAHELGQQVRILIDALETARRIGNAVEIRAESDMVDAGHLPDVIDMIGDLRERRLGLRMLVLPRRERCLGTFRLADVESAVRRTLEAGDLCRAVRLPAVDLLGHV